MPGKMTRMTRHTLSRAMNGMQPRKIVSREIFLPTTPSWQRVQPTGGVRQPISVSFSAMTPNQMGS